MKIVTLLRPVFVGALILVCASWVNAAVAPEIAKAITDSLKQARPDLNYGEVKASPISGLYQVQVTRGPMLYVSKDAKFLVAGDLFSIQPGEFVNIQEQARAKDRAKLMAAVDKKDQIIFSPKGETKAFINVFTDVDCGFCQKLHKEVPELNALGIEVRYLAYPRAGLGSSAYKKLATAWCAKDPQATLTKFKQQEPVDIAVCDNNPIAEQYALGEEIGVTGTPSLVLEDGTMLPGYMPAKELAAALNITVDEK